MWHFRSKYQKIRVLINVSYKQLKASLIPEVKKFGPNSYI